MATNSGEKTPRAMVHKRILESAELAPEASMESIAAEVTGASPALVERVLDEYGDPANSETEATETDPPTNDSMDLEISEQQRLTLEAVAEQPEATQATIAEELDVSPATVSKRLSDIPGFEWSDRATFVASFYEDQEPSTSSAAAPSTDSNQEAGGAGSAAAAETASPTASTTGPIAAVDGGKPNGTETAVPMDEVRDRLSELETQIEGDAGPTGRPIEDPELLAKVMRAVLADDSITAAEELDVLEALL